MLGHLPSSFCRIPGSFPNLRGEVLSLRTTTVTAAAGLLRHTPRWSPAGPSRTWPARPSCFPARLGKGRQVPLWSLQSPACPGPAWPPSLTSLPPPPPCSAPAVCLLLVPTLPPDLVPISAQLPLGTLFPQCLPRPLSQSRFSANVTALGTPILTIP